MNLFIMRHGTTVWNEKRLTQGRRQNRLSQSGKTMTEQVALDFASTPIDIIYTSPLMRTVQTANIMNQYHHVLIQKEERLTEIDQGIFTGVPGYNLTPKQRQQKASKDPACGMESYESVEHRVRQFYEELRTSCPYDNVLIITHDVTASILELIIQGKKLDFSNPHFRNFGNAEIKHFTIDR